MDARGIRHDKLVIFHCIVHQQSLCAKSVKFDHVVSVVTDCINFIKKRDLNNRIFKQVLKDFHADYDDLLSFCAVHWTSCGNMLGRFHSLLPEIIEFRNLKNFPLTELEEEKWLCDLGFMVDITKHLNDLIVRLQGPDQLLHLMFSKIKSFTSMLSFWENQLKDNDCTHFPTLKKYNPTSCAQYALECAGLLESFNARFYDIKSKHQIKSISKAPTRTQNYKVMTPWNIWTSRCSNFIVFMYQRKSFQTWELVLSNGHVFLEAPIYANNFFLKWTSQKVVTGQG